MKKKNASIVNPEYWEQEKKRVSSPEHLAAAAKVEAAEKKRAKKRAPVMVVWTQNQVLDLIMGYVEKQPDTGEQAYTKTLIRMLYKYKKDGSGYEP